MLLVTGPNTGGKTVTENTRTAGADGTIGSAEFRRLMARGFRSSKTVFADIGDEQSVKQVSSTFSHITNLASMDHDLVVPGLVLLDEVGSSTGPIEAVRLAWR